MEVWIEDGDIDGGVIEDAIMLSQTPTLNYGTHTNIYLRGGVTASQLIQADLSTYSDITITSAKFGIHFYNVPGAMNIDWHKVLVSWEEGDKPGGGVSYGACSWSHSNYDTVEWYTAGCKGDGEDRLAIADGSTTIIADDNFPIPLTTALVQDWIDNPSNNNGIVMEYESGSTTTTRGYSCEAASGNIPYFYMEHTEAATFLLPRGRMINL